MSVVFPVVKERKLYQHHPLTGWPVVNTTHEVSFDLASNFHLQVLCLFITVSQTALCNLFCSFDFCYIEDNPPCLFFLACPF